MFHYDVGTLALTFTICAKRRKENCQNVTKCAPSCVNGLRKVQPSLRSTFAYSYFLQMKTWFQPWELKKQLPTSETSRTIRFMLHQPRKAITSSIETRGPQTRAIRLRVINHKRSKVETHSDASHTHAPPGDCPPCGFLRAARLVAQIVTPVIRR